MTIPIRIYVAGPMQGLPEHGYPAFDEACEYLRNWRTSNGPAFEVISPHELHDEDETTRGTTKTHHEYMRADIAALATCDTIVLLDGWTKSKGACAELAAALAMGLEVWRFDRTVSAPDNFYQIS